MPLEKKPRPPRNPADCLVTVTPVVRTSAGTVQVFAQNMDAGGRVPAPGTNVVLSWAPESTFVVDWDATASEEEETA